MAKTLKRNNPPEVEKIIGDQFYSDAVRDVEDKDYHAAARDYKIALSSYQKALEDLEGHPKLRGKLEGLIYQVNEEIKDVERKSHLHHQTHSYPPILRWIIGKFKGTHVVGFLVFSLIFSNPTITGAAIGYSGASTYLGILFLFLGILGCYILVWKNFLIRRNKDQY